MLFCCNCVHLLWGMRFREMDNDVHFRFWNAHYCPFPWNSEWKLHMPVLLSHICWFLCFLYLRMTSVNCHHSQMIWRTGLRYDKDYSFHHIILPGCNNELSSSKIPSLPMSSLVQLKARFQFAIWCKASTWTIHLTHWGWDKMDAISQTTFSNAFSWMKMFEHRLQFHWNLFLRVQLTIFLHWFR